MSSAKGISVLRQKLEYPHQKSLLTLKILSILLMLIRFF